MCSPGKHSEAGLRGRIRTRNSSKVTRKFTCLASQVSLHICLRSVTQVLYREGRNLRLWIQNEQSKSLNTLHCGQSSQKCFQLHFRKKMKQQIKIIYLLLSWACLTVGLQGEVASDHVDILRVRWRIFLKLEGNCHYSRMFIFPVKKISMC